MSPSRTPRRGRLRATALVLAAMGLLAAGCGSDGEEASSTSDAPVEVPGVRTQNLDGDAAATPIDGGSIVFGLEAETDGWNPTTNRWAGSGHYVASSIFDPLAAPNADGEMEPYLAESITPNEDATIWTITVPEGVTFHDGTPLTSEAVKANLDAHKQSLLTAAAIAAVDEVEIVDGRTVEVTMSEPWRTFPVILSSQVGYVIPPAKVADPTSSELPVGTGPFVFDSWEKGDRLIVQRNEAYWQEGLPHLDRIEFRPIPDSQQRYDDLTAGELDVIHTIAVPDIVALRSSDFKMVEVANGEEAFLVLNTQQPPFDRREARLALAHATDIDRFLDETGRDAINEPARGAFAPGTMGYREDNAYPAYDVEKAKEYAAQYQAATGQPLTFTYTGASYLDALRAQQSLVAMWAEAGIDVEVQTIPQEQQILDAALGSYQAIDFRNFGSVDPDGDLVWWHSRSVGEPGGISLNFPRFGDPEIDQALMEGRASADPAVRDEAYATVDRRLNEEAPYVWLERVNWALAANPRVFGIGAAQNGTLSTLGAKVWIADLWVGPPSAGS